MHFTVRQQAEVVSFTITFSGQNQKVNTENEYEILIQILNYITVEQFYEKQLWVMRKGYKTNNSHIKITINTKTK